MEKTTSFIGKKILIIEDEPDIANLVVTYLQNYGFKTFHATWGAAGIRLAEAEKPDLIILDILLPDMDGWEVLEEIKKRHIPTRIIMLTKIEGVSSIIRFMRAGACDYINKPFDIEDLRMRIDRALENEMLPVQKRSPRHPTTVRDELDSTQLLYLQICKNGDCQHTTMNPGAAQIVL